MRSPCRYWRNRWNSSLFHSLILGRYRLPACGQGLPFARDPHKAVRISLGFQTKGYSQHVQSARFWQGHQKGFPFCLVCLPYYLFIQYRIIFHKQTWQCHRSLAWRAFPLIVSASLLWYSFLHWGFHLCKRIFRRGIYPLSMPRRRNVPSSL